MKLLKLSLCTFKSNLVKIEALFCPLSQLAVCSCCLVYIDDIHCIVLKQVGIRCSVIHGMLQTECTVYKRWATEKECLTSPAGHSSLFCQFIFLTKHVAHSWYAHIVVWTIWVLSGDKFHFSLCRTLRGPGIRSSSGFKCLNVLLWSQLVKMLNWSSSCSSLCMTVQLVESLTLGKAEIAWFVVYICVCVCVCAPPTFTQPPTTNFSNCLLVSPSSSSYKCNCGR